MEADSLPQVYGGTLPFTFEDEPILDDPARELLGSTKIPRDQLSSWTARLSGLRTPSCHQICITAPWKLASELYSRYAYYRRIDYFSSFESQSIYHYYKPGTSEI